MYRDLFRPRFLVCLNLIVLLVLAAACQAQAQPGSEASTNASTPTSTTGGQEVILKVGDLQITKATFEQYVADLETQQGPAELTRKQLADNYASMLMLAKMAAANHLDASPEVQRQLAIDRMQILSNAEFARLKADAKTSPAEIKAYYDSHLEDFETVEMRRFFIWSAGNAPDAAKRQVMTIAQADKLADAMRQAFKSGGDISQIRKLINDTPHATEEVVIDDQPLPFQKGELPPTLEQAAFSLKPGEWTEMHNGPGYYVFLKVVSRGHKDLNEVSPQIEKKLDAEKLREELESAKKKTGIWLDEAYFASKGPMPTPTTQPESSGQSKSTTDRGEK